METVETEPWENFPASPDLEITIGDSVIKCHKVVLQFRSPVFRSMFDHNMVENNKNKLTINDIDEKTFLIFLRHLYEPEQYLLEVGKQVLSVELLSVANQYQVRSLFEVFNFYSESFVKVDNAIECAIYASQFGSSWTEKLLNFIADNYKLIRKRENFGLLKKELDFMIALFDKLDFDPYTSCAIRQQSSVEMSYPVDGNVTESITTTDGWILSVSQSEGRDTIFLDINKKNFNSQYIYTVNITIKIEKFDSHNLVHEFKSICIYSGETIRNNIVSKIAYQGSDEKLHIKLEYWKNKN